MNVFFFSADIVWDRLTVALLAEREWGTAETLLYATRAKAMIVRMIRIVVIIKD